MGRIANKIIPGDNENSFNKNCNWFGFFIVFFFLKSQFLVKISDNSAKRKVKDQLIHEVKQAIDKTSFHALPLVTADVASWFKV